jgi:thiamine biosynthesis protein ThiS
MRLKLNGKEREVPPLGTVEDLIRHLEIHRMIVVEHNGEILSRESYSERAIRDGDALEIVHMVGGG